MTGEPSCRVMSDISCEKKSPLKTLYYPQPARAGQDVFLHGPGRPMVYQIQEDAHGLERPIGRDRRSEVKGTRRM